MAMRIIARLRQLLSIEIPVDSLFEHPTVVELAKALTELPSVSVTVTSSSHGDHREELLL